MSTSRSQIANMLIPFEAKGVHKGRGDDGKAAGMKQSEHHKRAHSLLKRAGYAEGGIIIPTAEETKRRPGDNGIDMRGDMLRKSKGKSPLKSVSDAMWNETVESAAQGMDRKPYKLKGKLNPKKLNDFNTALGDD